MPFHTWVHHPRTSRRGRVALAVMLAVTVTAGVGSVVGPGDRSNPTAGLIEVVSADAGASEGSASPPDTDATATALPTSVRMTGVDLGDPTVLADGGRYVLAGTNIGTGELTQNVPAATSTDLVTWSATFDLLPELPSWATEGFTWAPSLTRVGDEYQLYFTAQHSRSRRQCIGVATSASASGPFRSADDEPLVCQLELGGSIDPEAVTIDGERWLMWKNDGNCCEITTAIWVQRLDGRRLVGSAAAVLSADARWEDGVIENPSALDTGATTVVLFSANDWSSDDYGTGAAQCVGAWLGCEKRSRSATVLISEPGTSGSGGASFFERADGEPYLAWHAWRTRSDGTRVRTVVIDSAARVGV